jgi:hypothetical protein
MGPYLGRDHGRGFAVPPGASYPAEKKARRPVNLFRRRVCKRQLQVTHFLSLYNQRDAAFVAAHRKWFSDVFVRDGIQYLQVGIGATLDHAPSDLYFFVRIVEIHNRQSDSRISLCVLAFKRTIRRADNNVIAISARPNRRGMRRAVRHESGEVHEIRTVNQLLHFI